MEILIILCFILLSAFIACLIIAKKEATHNFKCKHCEKEFKPEWTKLIFVTHSDNEYIIKCPYCKKKGCFKEKNQNG